MEIELQGQAQMIKVSPPNAGVRKSSKVRVVLEMEYTEDRWSKLGQLLMETEVVGFELSGEPVQPELDVVEPQRETLPGMDDADPPIALGEGA